MNSIRHKLVFALLVLGTLCGSAAAEDLSYLFGRMGSSEGSTYSWQIDYRQNFLRYLAWSAAWINEGHVSDHHRDGYSFELWGQYPLFHNKLNIAAGGGSYRYYDTQPSPDGTDSLDVHGWAPIGSLSLTYNTDSPWFFRFTVNWILPNDNLQTRTAVLGVGYHLWKSADEKADLTARKENPEPSRPLGNELTLSLGKSIVNTLNSQKGTACGLEYRKEWARYSDWTVSFINEGDAQLIKRGGFATQLWLTDAFLDSKLRIGFGAGPYVFVDRDETTEGHSDVTGVVGPTISWKFRKDLIARLTWNRVITDYNRDTDVFLLGVGWRWGEKE